MLDYCVFFFWHFSQYNMFEYWKPKDVAEVINDVLQLERGILPVHKLLSRLRSKGFVKVESEDVLQDFKIYLNTDGAYYLFDKIVNGVVINSYFVASALRLTSIKERNNYSLAMDNVFECSGIWNDMDLTLFKKCIEMLVVGKREASTHYHYVPIEMSDWVASNYIENVAFAISSKVDIKAIECSKYKAMISLLKVMTSRCCLTDDVIAENAVDKEATLDSSEQILENLFEELFVNDESDNLKPKSPDGKAEEVQETNIYFLLTKYKHYFQVSKSVVNAYFSLSRKMPIRNVFTASWLIFQKLRWWYQHAIMAAIYRIIDEAAARRSYLVAKILIGLFREDFMTIDEIHEFISSHLLCKDEYLCTFEKVTIENTRSYLEMKFGKSLIESRNGYALNKTFVTAYFAVLETDLIANCARRVVSRFPQGIPIRLLHRGVSKLLKNILDNFALNEKQLLNFLFKFKTMFFVPGDGTVYPAKTLIISLSSQKRISGILAKHINQYGAIPFHRASDLFENNPEIKTSPNFQNSFPSYIYTNLKEFTFTSGKIGFAEKNDFLNELHEYMTRWEIMPKTSKDNHQQLVTQKEHLTESNNQQVQLENKDNGDSGAEKESESSDQTKFRKRSMTQSKIFKRSLEKVKRNLKSYRKLKFKAETAIANISKLKTLKAKIGQSQHSEEIGQTFKNILMMKTMKKCKRKKTFKCALKNRRLTKSLFNGKRISRSAEKNSDDEKPQEFILEWNFQKLLITDDADKKHDANEKMPRLKGMRNTCTSDWRIVGRKHSRSSSSSEDSGYGSVETPVTCTTPIVKQDPQNKNDEIQKNSTNTNYENAESICDKENEAETLLLRKNPIQPFPPNKLQEIPAMMQSKTFCDRSMKVTNENITTGNGSNEQVLKLRENFLASETLIDNVNVFKERHIFYRENQSRFHTPSRQKCFPGISNIHSSISNHEDWEKMSLYQLWFIHHIQSPWRENEKNQNYRASNSSCASDDKPFHEHYPWKSKSIDVSSVKLPKTFEELVSEPNKPGDFYENKLALQSCCKKPKPLEDTKVSSLNSKPFLTIGSNRPIKNNAFDTAVTQFQNSSDSALFQEEQNYSFREKSCETSYEPVEFPESWRNFTENFFSQQTYSNTEPSKDAPKTLYSNFPVKMIGKSSANQPQTNDLFNTAEEDPKKLLAQNMHQMSLFLEELVN